MPSFRHFYIGELKPGGSLKELSGLVETQLKGTDLHVGEASQDAHQCPLKAAGPFGHHLIRLATLGRRYVFDSQQRR
jgi:hypothetical protein